MNIIGLWAGDVISLEYKPMYILNKPINFRERENETEEYHFATEETIRQQKEREELDAQERKKRIQEEIAQERQRKLDIENARELLELLA